MYQDPCLVPIKQENVEYGVWSKGGKISGKEWVDEFSWLNPTTVRCRVQCSAECRRCIKLWAALRVRATDSRVVRTYSVQTPEQHVWKAVDECCPRGPLPPPAQLAGRAGCATSSTRTGTLLDRSRVDSMGR